MVTTAPQRRVRHAGHRRALLDAQAALDGEELDDFGSDGDDAPLAYEKDPSDWMACPEPPPPWWVDAGLGLFEETLSADDAWMMHVTVT